MPVLMRGDQTHCCDLISPGLILFDGENETQRALFSAGVKAALVSNGR